MSESVDLWITYAIEEATSPAVVQLLRDLAARARTLAEMQEELSAQTVRRREAETGKPFKLTKAQLKTIAHYTEDPAKTRAVFERTSQHMDDAGLLIVARRAEEDQLTMAEALLKAKHPDDVELATRIIEFRWETLRIIHDFIEASPHRESIRSMDWLWKPRAIADRDS